MRVIDLTGKVFGRLTVVGRAANSASGKARWTCQCECGTVREYLGNNLVRGLSPSCGCIKRERFTTHGKSHDPKSLYMTWENIVQRTTNPRNASFKNYGGRGVALYPAWRSSFAAFDAWIAENLGPRPRGKTLDRIDNDGNYEPGNLRWATKKEQQANRRNSRS